MKENSKKKVQCHGPKNMFYVSRLPFLYFDERTNSILNLSKQSKKSIISFFFSKKIIFIPHIFSTATSNYGFLKNHTDCYVVKHVCLLEKESLFTKDKK